MLFPVPRPQPGPGPGIRLPTWAKRQPIHLWPLIAIRRLCLQIGRTKPGAADASPNPSPFSSSFPLSPPNGVAAAEEKKGGGGCRQLRGGGAAASAASLQPASLSISLPFSSVLAPHRARGSRPWRPEERWRRRHGAPRWRARSPKAERAAVERFCGGALYR